MQTLHFWHMINLLKVIEALANEKYNFRIESNENGTWDIEISDDQSMHTNKF